MPKSRFMKQAHSFDFLSQTPEALVISKDAIYFVEGEESKIIPINTTIYQSIRETLKHLYGKEEAETSTRTTPGTGINEDGI